MTEHIDEDALKYILSIPRGRKVIWEILAFAGIYRQPFVPGNPDLTAMNSGALNVGLMLLSDCMITSPELTAMMTKEQGNDDNSRSNVEHIADDKLSALGNTTVPVDDNLDALGLGFDRSGK